MYLRWVDVGLEKWHPGTRIKEREITKLNLNQKNYQTDISMTEKYCLVWWLDSGHSYQNITARQGVVGGLSFIFWPLRLQK